MKRYREDFKEKQGGVIGITLNMDWRPGRGRKHGALKCRAKLRNTRRKYLSISFLSCCWPFLDYRRISAVHICTFNSVRR